MEQKRTAKTKYEWGETADLYIAAREGKRRPSDFKKRGGWDLQ